MNTQSFQPTEESVMREVIFEKVRRKAGAWISPDALRLKVERDVMYDRIAVQLSASLLAHEVGAVHETEDVPATWFDHLKQALGLKHKTRKIDVLTKYYNVFGDQGKAVAYAQAFMGEQ